MAANDFKLKIQAVLDKAKSIANMKADIKSIEPRLPELKIQGTLNSAATKKELNTKLKSLKPKVNIDADTAQAEKKIKKIGRQKNKATITPAVDNTQIMSELRKTEKETKSLWKRLTENIIGSNLIRMSVQKVTQAIYQAIAAVKELDHIKTNIQTASGVSDAEINGMIASYNQIAKHLSLTTKEVGNTANEIVRMGESLSHTNKLIESSSILAKIGMLESSKAVEYLISSMNGFQVSSGHSMEIIDKLAGVDMRAAVSAGGLAEAMSKCADIANSSGTSMDRLIGYMAAVGKNSQDSMSLIGDTFHSMYSRMNNIQIGRFIDDETSESLSDAETALNELGIQLKDTENTYRDFDAVLDDVGKNWSGFTQTEQNAISTAIAGTMHRERFITLMNNYASALEYSEAAANSAGSALERYGIYQNSIEAKTNELTAAIESLSTNIITEELYNSIIQATTGLVAFLDKTNLLKGTLAGLVAMGAAKAVVSIGTGFIAAAKSTAQFGAAMALFKNGLDDENLETIGAACKGLSDKQLKLILSTKGLKHEKRKLILAGMGVVETEREQMLTTLGFSAAQDKAATSTFSLRGAMNGLKTAIALNPIIAIATAVSATVMAFSAYSNAIAETKQKAKAFGSEIQNTKSEIENYKNRIAELQNTIRDSSASFEDVSHARENLMDIQDELIQKFGAEKETIESITGAINDQADSLDTLTQKQYQQWKNEFNNKSFTKAVGDFLASDNIASAFYKLTEFDFSGAWDMLTAPAKSNIDEMVASMQYAYYKIEKSGNDTLDALIAKTYDLRDTGSDFVLSGNLNNIYEDLLGIQEMSRAFHVSDKFETSLAKTANAMNHTLNSYKEAYRTFILYEKILDGTKDNRYDEQFNLINKAKETYDDALVSGDRDKIKKASDEYAQVLQSAIDLAMQNSDADVADYFKSMYPELQQIFGTWQFKLNFKPNIDGLQDKVTDALDSIDGISDGAASFSVEDIENFNPNLATQKQVNAYGELTNVAESYGLTFKQLIALLQTMGLVQSENYQQLVDTFGKENVDRLSPEDIEIAYKIENAGNMTFEQLRAEIQSAKETVTGQPATLSVTDTISQLSTRLKPALSSLQSAYQEIFTANGKFDLNSIDILSACDSIKSKLDELNETEGITVDYSAFENFVKVLNNTESTEQNVETAFDSLAASITQAALTGAENFELMKSVLEDLGVANSEMVAFDALIKNTAALKEAGLDLADAEDEEIQAFTHAIVSTENYDKALSLLRIQKILCAENPLSTVSDIQNLYMLAQAAGIATDTIKTLMALNTAYEKASAEGDTLTATAVKGQMELVRKQVIDQFANLGNDVDFKNIGGDSKSASNAGSAAADAYLDAFEKELKDLQNLKDNGILSEKEYLDRLRILYEHYFKDKAQYAEQYAQYERKYLNGYKSLYESLFSHASSLVGGRISLLQEEKDAAIEALEAQKKAAEESYETQIRLLEDKKAAIQDEIDRIREANEDRKEALSLQEKEQALARAEAQRTLLRYSEDRGFYYDTDTEAIQEARKELDDARADAEIRALEKQQDALDSQIDSLKEMADAASEYWDTQKEQTEEYYDALTGRMEEYKSRWEELAGLQEQARMAALAKELGYSEEDLINESSGALEHLKLTYLGILKDLNARNPDFLDSLSRLAGQDLGHIPGFLEGTRQAMEGLAQTDTSALAGGLQDIGKNLSSVASSAGDAAAAISGDGVTGTPGEPAQADGGAGQTAGTKTVPKGKVSLKAAIRDLSTQSVEGIAKISGAFAGEDGEGASVTGAIQKVTDKLGNADPENAEPDSLMAVQKEQAREALDEEHGIPAQEQAWESLNGPLEKAAAAVTALQEALEDMDGREYTVTIHTLGDGGALVDTVLGSYSTQDQSGRPLTGSPAAVSGSSGNRSRHGGSGNHDGRDGSFTADAEPAPESKAAGFPDTVRPLPPQYIPYPPENDHSRSAEMYRTFRAAIEDSGKMTNFLAAAPKINPAGPLTGFSGGNNYNNVSNRNFYPTITGGLHITCPGVTSSEVMKQVGIALQREFHGLSNKAIQESMLRK